jgi:hypothetical protein
MGKLLLLLLVALGVGLAVPKTRVRIANPVLTGVYRQLVPNRVEMIASQLDFVRKRGDRLPESDQLADWIESNTTVPPLDPWGNAYYLEKRSDRFTVGSMGQDSVRGTPDDLTAVRTGATR